VADVMTHVPDTVRPEETIGEVLVRLRGIWPRDVIVNRDGTESGAESIEGVLRFTSLLRVPSERRDMTTIGDLRTHLRRVHVVKPEDPLAPAIEEALGARAEYLLAAQGGALLGLVGRDELDRELSRRAAARTSRRVIPFPTE
jgi:hypothetical protein